MDPRSPIPGTLIEGENARRERFSVDVHEAADLITSILIDGENLERSRFAADRPFPFSPVESLLIVLVTLAGLAAVLWGM